jgi:hypothetical protein
MISQKVCAFNRRLYISRLMAYITAL